ncbi:hypothetical protein BX667DRAFT_539671, partial [Coemansia mojavensis]
IIKENSGKRTGQTNSTALWFAFYLTIYFYNSTRTNTCKGHAHFLSRLLCLNSTVKRQYSFSIFRQLNSVWQAYFLSIIPQVYILKEKYVDNNSAIISPTQEGKKFITSSLVFSCLFKYD